MPVVKPSIRSSTECMRSAFFDVSGIGIGMGKLDPPRRCQPRCRDPQGSGLSSR